MQIIVLHNGNPKIGILSHAGPLANFHLDPGAFTFGPEDLKTHQEIWGRIQSTFDLKTCLVKDLTAKQLVATLRDLEGLRGFYAGCGQEDMARLTQSLIVYLKPNATSVRKYADMDKIDENGTTLVPQSLHDAVREVNNSTRNVFSPKQIPALAERVKYTECHQLALAVLALEKEAQVYPKSFVELAHLEIRDAVRFADTEWKYVTEKSGDAAATIVRKYFEEYFQNEYKAGDRTPGLSRGISLRRTDCSTPAVLAYEMLTVMGLKSGTETILLYKDGKPFPGASATIYNFIESADGARTYYDLCLKPDEQYKFTTNQPIRDRDTGGNNEFELRVLNSGTQDTELYRQLVKEPILKEVITFCAASQNNGGTLPPFLNAFREYIPMMQKLCAFLKQVDLIFGKQEMDAWGKGTQESIRSLYRIF